MINRRWKLPGKASRDANIQLLGWHGRLLRTTSWRSGNTKQIRGRVEVILSLLSPLN